MATSNNLFLCTFHEFVTAAQTTVAKITRQRALESVKESEQMYYKVDFLAKLTVKKNIYSLSNIDLSALDQTDGSMNGYHLISDHV